MRNPEDAALRGLWGRTPSSSNELDTDLNPKAQHTQFADFHGHGWVFRAVFKNDRKGKLLDARGRVIKTEEPEKFKEAVPPGGHPLGEGDALRRLPLRPDVHGNSNLYSEVRAAIEIALHRLPRHDGQAGDARGLGAGGRRGAYQGKVVATQKDLTKVRTRNERGRSTPVFQRIAAATTRKGADGKDVQLQPGDVVQNSMVEQGLRWEVVQTVDTIDAGQPRLQREVAPGQDGPLRATARRLGRHRRRASSSCAHANSNMSCIACHSSWNPSCFGCHLPQKANRRCRCCTTRAGRHAQLHRRTTSRRCATTSSCWPATAT